jgi:hypothetical protein
MQPGVGQKRQFRNYGGLIKIARCGLPWEKTTKWPIASIDTNRETALALAVGAIVRAAASQDHAANRCSAYQAWLPGAEIDPMLELEEAGYASRVHIIRYRRPAERDGLSEDGLQTGMQAIEFGPLQVASHPAGPDSGTEKTLVGIDIAHSVQQLLVQQGSLNGCAAGPEERGELVGRDVERLLAGAREGGRLLGGDAVQLHTPESPGVHEAEFPP